MLLWTGQCCLWSSPHEVQERYLIKYEYLINCFKFCVHLSFSQISYCKMVRADKERNPILFLSIKLLLPSAIFTRLAGNTINVNIAPCNYIKTSLDVKTYISSFIKKLSSNWYNKFKITGGF